MILMENLFNHSEIFIFSGEYSCPNFQDISSLEWAKIRNDSRTNRWIKINRIQFLKNELVPATFNPDYIKTVSMWDLGYIPERWNTQ